MDTRRVSTKKQNLSAKTINKNVASNRINSLSIKVRPAHIEENFFRTKLRFSLGNKLRVTVKKLMIAVRQKNMEHLKKGAIKY